jgi:hypothetical protein
MPYPNDIDVIPEAADGEEIPAAHHNQTRQSILAIENELGTNPSGDESTVAARLSKLAPAYRIELETPLHIFSPLSVQALAGQFVPLATEVEITVDIGHVFFEAPGGWAWWGFYAGPVGSVLSRRHQDDALAAGVQEVNLGSISALQGTLSRTFLLTGLTPGEPVDWEIVTGCIGGAATMTAVPYAVSPMQIAMGRVNSAQPENVNWGGVRFSDSSVGILKAEHHHHATGFKDTIAVTFSKDAQGIGTTSTSGRVAITPDQSRIIVTHVNDNAVTIFTTGAGTNGGTAPAFQQRVVLTGTGTQPGPVVCLAGNTYAWVGKFNGGTGRIQRVNLITGALDTEVNLAQASHVSGMAVDPAGTYLYIVLLNGTIVKFRLSDNTVVGTLALSSASGTPIYYADISTDGVHLYVAASTLKRVWRVQLSDFTEQATNTVAHTPTGIKVFQDDESLLLSCSDEGMTVSQIKHLRTDDLSQYVAWPNRLGTAQANDGLHRSDSIALGAYDSIYVPNFTKKVINRWFNGKVYLDQQGFFSGYLTMRALPASE